MKARALLVILAVMATYTYAQRQKPYQRAYSNDIPALQIVGIAMSENMDNAFKAIETRGKEQAQLAFAYPVMVDAPCSLSSVQKAPGTEQIQDAWDMQSGSQFTSISKVARQLRLEKFGPVSCVLLDRQMRIRAIAASPAAVQNIADSRFSNLIEQLLLNIGGVEAVPQDASNMSDEDLRDALDLSSPNGLCSWELAADLQRRESERGVDDAQRAAMYPLFGQTVPDFELPYANGSGTTTLSEISRGKVTLVVLFWAGGGKSDFTAIGQTNAALEQLKAIERCHVNWTLKLAEPGQEEHPTAQPFSGTSANIVKGSARGTYDAKDTEMEKATAAEQMRVEKERRKDQPSIEKRFSIAAAAGIRYYSWEEFDQQDLSKVNIIGGLKFGVQIADFWAAELSLLPSYMFGNFAEDDDHLDQKRQLYFPLSINVLVKPSLADGFFSPFVTLGAGPAFSSFKKRIRNPDYVNYSDINNPKSFESYYADGIGLQINPGIGGEFRITESIFAGLDIRYMFMTIAKDVLDPDALDEESNAFARKEAIQKDFKYDNACLMVYGGLKF